MINNIESWLLNKVKNQNTFWAKVIAGLCALLLGVILIIKYRYYKDQVIKLKTKDVLATDNKKDAVLQEQLKNIKEKKGTLIKEVIKLDSKINTIDGHVNKVKKEAKSDLEFVESLDDWDEIDRKIK